MLLITTSTGNEFLKVSTSVTLNDLEPPKALLTPNQIKLNYQASCKVKTVRSSRRGMACCDIYSNDVNVSQ